MKTIEAYQTYDGKLFTNEKQAIEHDDDLIGQELDALFKLVFKMSDNVGHQAIYQACVNALKDKQSLRNACGAIVSIIDFNEN